MAMQSPFFGKQQRDAEAQNAATAALNARTQQGQPGAANNGARGVLGSASSQTGNQAGVATSPFTSPQGTESITTSQPAQPAGSKLTVGPNIKLKGVEITDCDTLVVEGLVEATMDSRVMQISEKGSFRGSAEIDIAEIHGEFDGNLTVRQKLTIHTTGRVTGKIRYGKVVIEEGGQLTGDIEFSSPAGRMPPVAKPMGIQAAA